MTPEHSEENAKANKENKCWAFIQTTQFPDLVEFSK